MINLCKRPKIDVSIRNLEIKFVTADGTEHFLSYIGLDFLNNEESTLEININGIFINREKYINLNGISIIGEAAYISQENKTRWPCWESCNNDVFSAMKENWRDICQNNYCFKIDRKSNFFFPLSHVGLPGVIINQKKEPRIFSYKNKVILTIEINRVEYEYGISRTFFYEKCLSFLVGKIKSLP